MRLLSHIARTVPQTENLATDALAFVLSKSVTARRALVHFVSDAAVVIPPNLTFRTQARDENGTIPDIAGVDADGQERLLIEAKFWAGLTGNQPTEYLSRFAQPGDCLLLFVVPEARRIGLWQKVMGLCREKGMAAAVVNTPGPQWDCARTSDHRFIGITSWRRLLDFIGGELHKAGEREAADDLSQLSDLCDQMDQEAFLPLTGGDLAPQIGRRVYQYCDLVDRVTGLLRADGTVVTQGLSTRRSRGVYGQYCKINGFGCCVSFDLRLWSRCGETPLWLEVLDTAWQASPLVRGTLSPLFDAAPPKAREFEGHFYVPLHPRLNVDLEDVVADLAEQVRSVATVLPNSGSPSQQPAALGDSPADGTGEAQA